MTTLTPTDHELIQAASDLLLRTHDAALHRVAAAARGVSGAVYLGLSLATPRVSVCAESSAIANAKMAGEEAITTIVSVGLDPADRPVVINPCGVCREVVPTFGRDLHVLVSVNDDVTAVTSDALLPITAG